MPSKDGENKDYEVYELNSSDESILLYSFNGRNAGYFNIREKISGVEVDRFMRSRLEISLESIKIKLKDNN